MANLTYSERGLALTRQFEGLRLESYQDQRGIWTIGYGHTGPTVHEGLRITEAEAEILLTSDVVRAAAAVNRLVTAQVTQNQFDALVDFAYNLGCATLMHSTLLRLINAGEFAEAASEFPRWNHSGNRPIPGLLRRRRAEMELFNLNA